MAALPTLPPPDRPVPFQLGEILTFEASWTMLLAGTIVMAVKERRPTSTGRSGYYLFAEGKPSSIIERLYHLYYKADAVLDTQSLLSDWSAMYTDEKGHIENRLSKFVGGRNVEYQELISKEPKQTFAVPAGTVDALSALYVIRSMKMSAGDTIALSVFDAGKTLKVRAPISGPESLRTPLGTFSAWRLTATIIDDMGQPAMENGLNMWISNDARRLPLKIEAGLSVGTVTLMLTKLN